MQGSRLNMLCSDNIKASTFASLMSIGRSPLLLFVPLLVLVLLILVDIFALPGAVVVVAVAAVVAVVVVAVVVVCGYARIF